MNNQDRCFCELAPLYALNLLTEPERQWVEEQIAGSPELAAELAELQATAGAIAYSVPLVPMATDLKDRLFQRLNQDVLPDAPIVDSPPSLTDAVEVTLREPTEVSWLKEQGSLPSSNQRQHHYWQYLGGAIAAAVFLMVLIDNYWLRQNAQVAKTVIETLQQPNLTIHTLQGTQQAPTASGSLAINPTQKTAVILVKNLPPLSSDQVYRLWAIPQGSTKPTYCGQFNSSTESITTHWVTPAIACGNATAQLLITAELVSDPPIPAGPLVMKSANEG